MEEDDSKVIFLTTPLNEVVWYHGSCASRTYSTVFNTMVLFLLLWDCYYYNATLWDRYYYNGIVISAKQFHVQEQSG